MTIIRFLTSPCLATSALLLFATPSPLYGDITVLGDWDGFSQRVQGELSLDPKDTLSNNTLHIIPGDLATRPTVDLSKIPDLNLANGISVSMELSDMTDARSIFFSLKSQSNANILAPGMAVRHSPEFAFSGATGSVTANNLHTIVVPDSTPTVITVTTGMEGGNLVFHSIKTACLPAQVPPSQPPRILPRYARIPLRNSSWEVGELKNRAVIFRRN